MARSPNYPVIALDEALAAIRPAFKAENRNKMSRMVLASHMGYGSLSGRALGKIGAVRAYGLIEGSGDELRISDDAITALSAPVGSPEKFQAIARCALHPGLFKELHDEFPDGNVSPDNLKYQLIQRRYTEDAAEKAAENYLATLKLVSGDPNGYSSPNPNEVESAKGEDEVLTPAPDSDHQRMKAKVGMNEDTFAMKEGTVVLQWPNSLSQESYEDLEAWAQLVLRKVKRHVVADDKETNE